MTTQDVANRLVELCREGKNNQAIDELYSDHIVSHEPPGSPAPHVEGIDAVRQKEAAFNDMVAEWHGSTVSDPIVADNFFSVTMSMDITMKGAGRMNMEEVCVYGVKNGKIALEHFYFTPMPQG